MSNISSKLKRWHAKHPDADTIRIFLDTSSSMTRSLDANLYDECIDLYIKTIIRYALTNNLNLKFNSWSHYISKTTKLHKADDQTDTVSSVYETYRNTPMVNGGTDIDLIYTAIARSKNKNALYIILSDLDIPQSNINRDDSKIAYIFIDNGSSGIFYKDFVEAFAAMRHAKPIMLNSMSGAVYREEIEKLENPKMQTTIEWTLTDREQPDEDGYFLVLTERDGQLVMEYCEFVKSATRGIAGVLDKDIDKPAWCSAFHGHPYKRTAPKYWSKQPVTNCMMY